MGDLTHRHALELGHHFSHLADIRRKIGSGGANIKLCRVGGEDRGCGRWRLAIIIVDTRNGVLSDALLQILGQPPQRLYLGQQGSIGWGWGGKDSVS